MTYIIEENRLKDLLESEQLLGILECAGVDNWMSYSEAAESCDMNVPTAEELHIELIKFQKYEENI
jgi:hypothetical protein